MNANLRVTPEKMISTSGQFATSNTKVKSLTTSMMNIASELNPTWAGEAATAYYGKLKGLQGDMDKLYRMIKEHTDDLQEMAKVYQTAEKAAQQTANALKTNEIV